MSSTGSTVEMDDAHTTDILRHLERMLDVEPDGKLKWLGQRTTAGRLVALLLLVTPSHLFRAAARDDFRCARSETL